MSSEQHEDGAATVAGDVAEVRVPRVNLWVPLLLRAGALAGAAYAVTNWSPSEYGASFWLWVVSALAYAVSFRAARFRFARLPTAVWGALLAILVLAVALRLPNIEAVPGNISVDELMPGLQAQAIAAGAAPNVFSSLGWFSLPNLTFAFPAAVMVVVGGDALFSLRLSSLLTGVLGIGATFLLARRLFGNAAGLLAAFLMASSFWHIHNSRTGFPFVQSSCVVPLVLYLIVRARQDGSAMVMAVAGLALGLALQLYFPVRALLVIAPLFLVADWMQRRERLRRMLADSATLGVGALLVLAPLLLSVSWRGLIDRSQRILISNAAKVEELSRLYRIDGVAAVLWRNTVEAANQFLDWADVCILNRSPEGLLDGVTLAAVLVGAVAALIRGRGWPLVLFAWAAFVFVFGAAMTDAPRASYRLAPAMPAFFLLAGFAVQRVLLSAEPVPRWYRLTVWPLVFAGLAAFVLQENHHRFFVLYAERGHGKDVPSTTAMRIAGRNCDGRMFYVLAHPEPLGRESTFDFFCADHRALRRSQIPVVVDVSRSATFLVMPWRKGGVERIRHCYPDGRLTEYKRKDGTALLTRVDVGPEGLARGRERCLRGDRAPGEKAPMDLAALRRGGPSPVNGAQGTRRGGA
jgi:4-amino-4-deoxy-L-arabinose transferase-like glycosyltransferase